MYSKDATETRHRRLPNIGREFGTYLHHMAEQYNHLADWTLFLQGDPFPHNLLSIEQYAADGEDFIADLTIQTDLDFRPGWTSATQPIHRAAMCDFLRQVECRDDIASFRWAAGAQFSVSRQCIRRRPRAYYQRLCKIAQQPHVALGGAVYDNHHLGYFFEFFWHNIFAEPW